MWPWTWPTRTPSWTPGARTWSTPTTWRSPGPGMPSMWQRSDPTPSGSLRLSPLKQKCFNLCHKSDSRFIFNFPKYYNRLYFYLIWKWFFKRSNKFRVPDIITTILTTIYNIFIMYRFISFWRRTVESLKRKILSHKSFLAPAYENWLTEEINMLH